jgi:hypothetical protein
VTEETLDALCGDDQGTQSHARATASAMLNIDRERTPH